MGPDGLPLFAELPIKPGYPPGAAWDVFGDGDQVGTLNLLTPERIAAAARLVRKGAVFNLDLPLELPHPPFYGRHVLRHEIVAGEPWRDTVLHNFNTQTSSQIDGLRHYTDVEWGAYGGHRPEELRESSGPLGMERWARRGIAGRGVLVDVARHAEAIGRPLDPDAHDVIPIALVEETLAAQRTELRAGDILLLRTGWMAMYLAADGAKREALARDHSTPGLDHDRSVAAWLWDHRVAAVFGDNLAVEAVPHPLEGDSLHRFMLSLLGMPIGELLDFEALAADCAADGVYECFLTSSPLYVTGGVATPPNALALK